MAEKNYHYYGHSNKEETFLESPYAYCVYVFTLPRKILATRETSLLWQRVQATAFVTCIISIYCMCIYSLHTNRKTSYCHSWWCKQNYSVHTKNLEGQIFILVSRWVLTLHKSISMNNRNHLVTESMKCNMCVNVNAK